MAHERWKRIIVDNFFLDWGVDGSALCRTLRSPINRNPVDGHVCRCDHELVLNDAPGSACKREDPGLSYMLSVGGTSVNVYRAVRGVPERPDNEIVKGVTG